MRHVVAPSVLFLVLTVKLPTYYMSLCYYLLYMSYSCVHLEALINGLYSFGIFSL